MPKSFLRQRGVDLESRSAPQVEGAGRAPHKARIAPQQQPVRAQGPNLPVEVVGARPLQQVHVAVAREGLGRLIGAPQVLGPILGGKADRHTGCPRRIQHPVGHGPTAQIERHPPSRASNGPEHIIAVEAHLVGCRNAGLRVGPHLHAANRRAVRQDPPQGQVAVRPDVFPCQALHGWLHPGLDVVLPDAQCEVDAVVGCRLGDIAEHLQIPIPLVGGDACGVNLGELGYLEPKRVRRGQVVGLVREDQVKAIEAVPGQHGEVFVPVFAGVEPGRFQVFVMQE